MTSMEAEKNNKTSTTKMLLKNSTFGTLILFFCYDFHECLLMINIYEHPEHLSTFAMEKIQIILFFFFFRIYCSSALV